MSSSVSPAQQFANDVNAASPLIEAPGMDSPKWYVVKGRELREYYARSPYATISQHQCGFVVHNLVTGGKHPCATWQDAANVRSALASRYTTINAGIRY